MYQLYYSSGACSLAVHAVLNELNQPVELKNVSISEGKNKSPEFQKINPRGSVPVVVDDGQVIREGAAIIVYLCDKHKSPLLPREGKARASALEWLMFANATLHPAYGRAFGIPKMEVEESVKPQLKKLAIQRINTLWQDVDQHLSQQKYLAGDQVTAGDILLTVIANWSGNISPEITLGDNVKRLLKEISARPAFQKALAAENVQYKAAA